MTTPQNNKNEYAKHVSLFLAELLRSRKINLMRAAEIAQKVVENINLIDTEQQFLKFVKELSSDFEELFVLGERYHIHVRMTERKDLENKVQLFATDVMSHDLTLAMQVLQEAAREEVAMPDLCSKFPQFQTFIETHEHL